MLKMLNYEFLIQISSNGISRLLYMILIAMLTKLPAEYSNSHALLLGYCGALISIFGLNIYAYSIAEQGKSRELILSSCEVQYKLLIISSLILNMILFFFVSISVEPFFVIVCAINVSLTLAVLDVAFSILSIEKKMYRALVYYGGHIFFYAIYILCVSNKLSLNYSVLISSTLMLAYNLAVGIFLFKFKLNLLKHNLKSKKDEYIFRFRSLLVNIPEGFAVPLLLWLASKYNKESSVAEFLLFMSYAGMVVFIAGNLYQYAGREISVALIKKLRDKNYLFLAKLIILTFLACLILTIPVGFVISIIKLEPFVWWPFYWYISACIVAATISISQWFYLISLANKLDKIVLHSNLLYLFSVFIFSFLLINLPLLITGAYLMRFVFQMNFLFRSSRLVQDVGR